jgi:hypothetical protein
MFPGPENTLVNLTEAEFFWPDAINTDRRYIMVQSLPSTHSGFTASAKPLLINSPTACIATTIAIFKS